MTYGNLCLGACNLKNALLALFRGIFKYFTKAGQRSYVVRNAGVGGVRWLHHERLEWFGITNFAFVG